MGTLGRVALAAAVLAAAPVVAPVGHAASTATTYRPPYVLGPAGGDGYNVVHRDEAAGRMVVGRGFPGVPPVVGCAPEPDAGWATFRVVHRVRSSVSRVDLDVDAVLDPYAWVMLGVRTRSGWLGSTKVQGPLAEVRRLTLRLHRTPKPGEAITIEFGLQLGDACPQVGGAMATFPTVTVRS